MERSESLVERLSNIRAARMPGYEPSDQYRYQPAIIVFSVRDMEDELKPIAMYVITHYIWNACGANLKSVSWSLMRVVDDEERRHASFLYSVAKRGRNTTLGSQRLRKMLKTS